MKYTRSIYYSRCVYDLRAVISHEEGSLGLIIDLVKEFDPGLIVELGSAYYGMTLLFHECNKRMDIISYDRYPGLVYISRARGIVTHQEVNNVIRFGLNNNRVTLVTGDVIYKKNERLCRILNEPIKKLLYCDNGKKDREVSYYAPELNKGDMLGVHDWKTEVNPNKIKETLDMFTPCPINSKFKEKGLLSRFFIKNE